MKKIILIIAAFLIVLSCKNDDNNNGGSDNIEKFGTLTLDFSNTIEDKTIDLERGSYTNGSNETYAIAELKYIISNIVLITSTGEEFKYPVADSYFLINEAEESSKEISLTDIPEEEYTKIRFGFGVDQSKYPIESGTANFIPTAEENGMLWAWAAGYKFLKFEGTYNTIGSTTSNDFILHVGSHGANLDNYKEMTINLPSVLSIKEMTTPNVSINADIAKIFDSINTHSLEVKSDVQVDPVNAPIIAENVSTMFSITNVSN
ncbi:MbnP family protein [Aquimarina sp. MMG016]|uniref:MbnP family protein n=1 Tax=Aquimarina sp. MMG016 TaxID=2822690 RepID=UPI001B3A406D|nr:MbnP family protein [Aquimarina sp. MMG016]MBQ4819821.1 hypothetical protein [Aquimarina sp. MMG016]